MSPTIDNSFLWEILFTHQMAQGSCGRISASQQHVQQLISDSFRILSRFCQLIEKDVFTSLLFDAPFLVKPLSVIQTLMNQVIDVLMNNLTAFTQGFVSEEGFERSVLLSPDDLNLCGIECCAKNLLR